MAGPKVCTYQCLCRVNGTMRFALVNSTSGSTVYDEVVIKSPSGAFTDTTLVTLRAQISEETTSAEYIALRIENPDDGAAAQWQVHWQQAWGSEVDGSDYVADAGLRNTTYVRTESNSGVRSDYDWSVNTLSVKAVSRLQIPSLNPLRTSDRPVNAGWKNPYDNTGEYDLFDGEVYWDEIQQAVVARQSDGWYMVNQPERVRTTFSTNPYQWLVGTEKNLVYSGSN